MASLLNGLATGFSSEAKSLQTRMPKMACSNKKNNWMKFSFVGSVLLNARFRQISNFWNLILRRVNYNIFLEFSLKTMMLPLNLHIMLTKLRKYSTSNYKKILNYGRNYLPKLFCITEMDWSSSWMNCNEKKSFAKWEVMYNWVRSSTTLSFFLPRAGTFTLVNAARYLESITILLNSSWPLEPVQKLLTRLDGVYYTRSGLASAFNQVPLLEDAKKLTSFIVGGKQDIFKRGL